jgi:hypothetical protein
MEVVTVTKRSVRTLRAQIVWNPVPPGSHEESIDVVGGKNEQVCGTKPYLQDQYL